MPTYHNQFIHHVFGKFIETTAEFLNQTMYPRFKWTTIGTYNKAVEYITKKDQLGREPDKPLLPALIINPTEMNLGEASSGGQQLWRFPGFSTGFLGRIFEPIYKDPNLKIVPGFSRVHGTLECVALCNSYYEYLDLYLLMLQTFGGKERRIFPSWFSSHIILPNEILNYTFSNEVTGESYQLDWNNNVGSTYILVDTIGKDSKVLPCKIKPLFYLSDISDGSERYGGSDKLADWKLQFNVTYEVELPTFLHIEELRDLELATRSIKFNVRFGSSYSDYVSKDMYDSEENNQTSTGVFWPKFQTTQLSFDPSDYIYPTVNQFDYEKTISPDSTSELTLTMKTLTARYYLPLTNDILDSTSSVELTLPNPVSDKAFFDVSSKYGVLSYYDHYEISPDGTKLILKVQNITGLNQDDILEVFYFKGSEKTI